MQQNDENEETTRENDRQKILSEAMQLGDVNTKRIFSYQEKAPAAPESHQNPLRVVYSIKTPMSTKSGSRYIPTSPERILDAPDIINDYCKSCFMYFELCHSFERPNFHCMKLSLIHVDAFIVLLV